MQYQGYFFTVLVSIALHRYGAQRASSTNTFYNVVGQDGADPWVYRHTDGWYYSTRTTGEEVCVWRSRSLTSLYAGDMITIWKPGDYVPACKDFWAPEIHYIRSKW